MSSVSLLSPKLQDRLENEKPQARLGIHSFHRYFGKLIPAIPAAAVEEFTSPGDTVLDPFCGSGTTLVESLVRGRNAVGVDINPLSVLISQVKTTKVAPDDLAEAAERAVERGREIFENGSPKPPYCVNIHHWYRPKVIKQLASLHAAVAEEPQDRLRRFMVAGLSAINRNVSNADPQHVFPGYSKRLRKVDFERGRRLDVFDTFATGLSKRIGYLREFLEHKRGKAAATVHLGDAVSLPSIDEPVSLIVTNPPYISSVRYLETLKLEMSWAGFIDGPEDYRSLDRRQIGTERFSSSETSIFTVTGIRKVDTVSRNLFEKGQAKMSHTVSEYFRRMAAALDCWNNCLKPGGAMVFKISPSRVRDELVPTPEIVAEMLTAKGYKLIEQFEDKYNPNSRSLLTARNYYSGRMDSDVILVMVKP